MASQYEHKGGGHRYSTTEQVVGTWIDGKPIYEKTIYFSTPLSVSNGTWTSTGVSMGDIEAFVDNGILIDGITKPQAFPCIVGNMNDGSEIGINVFWNNTNVRTFVYLIVRYTKTTD